MARRTALCSQAAVRGLALAASTLALGFTQAAWAAQPSDRPTPEQRVVKHAKGRILVQPNAGLSNAELDKILSKHGGRRAKHLPQINVHVVELPAQASEVAVMNMLRNNPHIKFAELDVALEPNFAVNDPYFTSAWHLPKIGAPQAWDIKTGAGVVIAILDTGVDSSHPDLSPQLVPGWNTYDNNNDTADVHGHGTMVSGMAVAAGNNAAGSAGVAFGAKLMPIRISDPTGYGFFSTMAAGITWAADRGAKVASISFQGAAGSSTVNSAAQYMRRKGGVVVTASGNTGVAEGYAPSDHLTVVSASDSANNVASFSSYGEFVDLSAPGVNIYTTKRGGGYGAGSGTSAAAPIAAGVYALMMSANPLLTPSSLDSIMYSTALDIGTAGKDSKSGWGVVSASGAVLKASQTVSTDSSAPIAAVNSPGAGTQVAGLVPVSVSASDNVAVTRVELYVNGSHYATDTTSPYSFSWDTGTLPDGSATLMAKAYDAAGNMGSSSVTVTVASDTVAPDVSIQSPTNGALVTGTVNVTASATDNKKVASMSLYIDGKEVAKAFGGSLSYSWDTSSGLKKKGNGNGNEKASPSTTSRSIQVVAVDPSGNKTSKSISVTTQ